MQRKRTLSILIEGRNRASDLLECISNVKKIADEIIYVDTGSNDESLTIAKKFGIKTYCPGIYDYVEPVRLYGIKKCTKDWILVLDLDERPSNELIAELSQKIKDDRFSAFMIYRKNFFAKKIWLKHGGWWPDKVLRLVKKSAIIDWPSAIHSSPKIKGEIGKIKSPIIHYWKDSLSTMVRDTITFEEKEAQLLFDANKTLSLFTFFRKFIAEFSRRFLFKKGFLDGKMGYIMAMYQAFSKTLTYIFLYEKYKKGSNS